MSENQLKPAIEEKSNATRLLEDTIHNTAQTCNNVEKADFDLAQAKKKIERQLDALEVNGGLQTLLGSQILSINKLQQIALVMANSLPYGEAKHYYVNTAIKLSNTFCQQVNLLSKLQGVGGQKIIVERVDVHQGGQAVVGTINTPNRD